MAFGGAADRHLKEFCRRFNVEEGEDFHGFLVCRRRVLYRRATFDFRRNKPTHSPHWRWVWFNPLGKHAERHTHILLHGPEHTSANVDEHMFLFTREQMERFLRRWPAFIRKPNLPANPQSRTDEKREVLREHGMSPQQFRAWLKK